MTLVVARIANGVIAMAADTLLTEHNVALPISQGTIKICLLPGGICVGFAGSPELAEIAFRNYIHKFPLGTSIETAISYFENSSRKTENDYIVASCGGPIIVKISEGRRAKNSSKTVWIGDRDAYNCFVEIERKYRKSENTGRAVSISIFSDEMEGSPASDLYYSMKNVAASRNISTVGGLVVVASSRVDSFRFSSFCDLLYDWPKEKHDSDAFDLNEKITLGASGENFHCSLTQIPSGFLNANFVAFYFLKGKLLYIFYGIFNGLARNCQCRHNVEPEEIHKTIVEYFNADHNWLVWVFSGIPDDIDVDDKSDSNSGMRTGFFCHANNHSTARKDIMMLSYAPSYLDK